MKRYIKIGKRKIGPGQPVFIIAEAGSNHNRDLEQAKRLIDVAAAAGVDAVKFQLFKSEKLYPENCGIVDSPMGKIDFFKILKSLELPTEWPSILKKYAEEKGLVFLCTCFDEGSGDILERAGVEAYKLGSPELNHIPLLEHLAKRQKPMLLSTGISSIGEIEEAVKVCYRYKNKQVALLHCVSAYPTPLAECNLNIIKTLYSVFGLPVGFSDHTREPVIAPVIASAIGACIIEKHFTLSRTLRGPDHPFALEPRELSEMVEEVRKVEDKKDKINYAHKHFGKEKVQIILGSFQKIITPGEKAIYPNDKRSIHAIARIKKGSKLSKENIAVLRSERNLSPGIAPKFYDLILGKVVNKDIPYSKGIIWEDLLYECS